MSTDLLNQNIDAAIATLQAIRTLRQPLDHAAQVIADAYASRHKLMVAGNGGSAADAAHLATEFVFRFRDERPALPAIWLAASGPDLTAGGNDYSFSQVFSRQVEAYGQSGDVLVTFSSSGNSDNLIEAIAAAKARDVHTVSFLGKGGGRALGQSEIDILVPGTVTARCQEAQKLMLHTLCELVERRLGLIE